MWLAGLLAAVAWHGTTHDSWMWYNCAGSPIAGRIPLRVGPVIAGLPEIRKLWWGEDDPRQYVMGSRGKVQTFADTSTATTVDADAEDAEQQE